MVNEIYHRFNVNQVPFVFLNVLTPRCEVDVNLTPDKRQLLINNEKLLLLTIKKALLNTYGSMPSSYKIQNNTVLSMLKLENDPKTEENSKENSTEHTQNINENHEEEYPEIPISSTQRFMDVLSQWKHTGDTKGSAPPLQNANKRKCSDLDEITARTFKLKKIQEYLIKEEKQPEQNISKYSYKSESDSEADEGVERDGVNKFKNQSNENLNESLIDVNKLSKQSKGEQI